MELEEGGDKQGIQKPRRLEDATADYLGEIDIQYAELSKKREEEGNEEQRAILVQNVFQEIHSRTASAACDRRTNYIMEQLCFECDFPLLIQLIQSWVPYGIFMARNRYASHVIQAVLSRAGYLLRVGQTEGGSMEDFESAVVAFASPLLQEISWLGKEMSASHVIRSLLSLLLGLPLIAERKSKKSKHQHSVGYSEPLESLLEPHRYFISAAKVGFAVPQSFHTTIEAALEKLIARSPHDLQTQIANISSCAIITFLLRILSSPALFAPGPNYLSQLAEKVMYLKDIASSDFQRQDNERSSSLFYTMAGDRMGSYFLEILLEVSSWTMFVNLLDQYQLIQSSQVFCDYAKDASSNFIIQAIMRRIISEILCSGSSSASELGAKVIALMLESSAETFSNLLNRRPMVLGWLLELVAVLKDEEAAEQISERVLKAMQKLGEKEEQSEEEDDSATTAVDDSVVAERLSKVFEVVPVPYDKSGNSGKKDKKNSKSTEREVEGEEEALRDNGKGGSDAYQVNLAKILNALMRSCSKPTQSHAIRTVSNLSLVALKNIAVTGALSKALLDVFFEHFAQSSEMKTLGQKLASIASDLAIHYAGQHVLRKAYENSDLRGKEKWVTVLVANKTVLLKSKEGRNSLHLVNAEQYERDAAGWRTALKKQLKAASSLADLTSPPAQNKGTNSSGKAASSTSETKTQSQIKKKDVVASESEIIPNKRSREEDNEENDEEDEEDAKVDGGEAESGAKKKRKRKRPARGGANKANA